MVVSLEGFSPIEPAKNLITQMSGDLYQNGNNSNTACTTMKKTVQKQLKWPESNPNLVTYVIISPFTSSSFDKINKSEMMKQ